MVKVMFGVVAATLLGLSYRAEAWGGKKGEGEEAEMPKGKDAVELGRAGFRQVAGDIGLMNDLLQDLQDPETMKEVEKLMKDKDFKKEMDKMLASDDWKNGADDAMKFLQDPKAMEELAKKSQEYTDYLAAGPGKDGKRDAIMGINAAKDSLMDPSFMQDAMKMMQDPEVMKKVEATMKNPEFMQEMRRMMDNPEMKAALSKAGASVEELMNDPKLMAEAQRQMQQMMGAVGA